MNRLSLLVLIFLTFHYSVISQEVESSDYGSWDAYIAMYETGAGSTTLNMDLINKAPKKDLPFIVITGVTFSNCSDDGFPNKSEFDSLYNISDNVQSTLSNLTKMELAGSFTHQCERLDYIYVKDTTNIRTKLTKLYNSSYSNYKFYINIKLDQNWDAYLKFLYPNEETMEYMQNQKVLEQLLKHGDNLTKARQVDHWIYFKNSDDRNAFAKKVIKDGFMVEGKEKLEDGDRPYQLHISRQDKVDIESISKITLSLRKMASELNGDYDGWETFIVKE